LQIKITGKHIEITEAIRARIDDKITKAPRYYDTITQAEIIIDGSSGQLPSVEIIARGEHNKVFVAKESDADLYTAIDLASHKLERQLTKAKAKERDNKNTGGEKPGRNVTNIEQ
jgi:putative sigma-54 modulation protein